MWCEPEWFEPNMQNVVRTKYAYMVRTKWFAPHFANVVRPQNVKVGSYQICKMWYEPNIHILVRTIWFEPWYEPHRTAMIELSPKCQSESVKSRSFPKTQ